MTDAKLKGRMNCRDKNGGAKLTQSEVDEVRRLRKKGTQLKELSVLFNVSLSQVSRICSGKRWGKRIKEKDGTIINANGLKAA